MKQTSQRARTPWGTGVDRPQVAVRVDPETKHKLNLAADAAGLSQPHIMDAIFECVEIDDEGHIWVGGVEIKTASAPEELPMTG